MNDVDARVDLSGFSAEYLGGASAALAQVELRIGVGESVLITGPSGSGKSTLALCLTGFIPNAVYARLSGGIRVCGVEPAAQGVYDMARRVGLVQQDAEGQFCTMRVEDEAAFGPENLMCSEAEIERRVSGALELAGAAHLAGRALAELSGGEKQRVAIASVLAMQPQLLVLDEPAAHLDPRATRSVADALRAIQRDSGLSVVILEHKPWRFAGAARRMVRLEQGRVVYDGPTKCDRPGRMRSPAANGPLLGGGEPLLSVRGLKHSYGGRGGRPALAGVDLDVGRGEIVGVMGDNGSGKTTLLRSIMGTVKPQAGRVTLGGDDISALPVSSRASRIGMVFQNPNHQLFTDSVWREVVVGPLARGRSSQECRPAALSLLRRFGLAHMCDRHPLTLSFGEKRRLNLAAAMVSDPDLLMLDEPFAGQDLERAEDLAGLLGEVADAGKGVLLVGHDPDIMAWCCHRVVFLEAGRVVLDGPASNVMAELAGRGERDYVCSV